MQICPRCSTRHAIPDWTCPGCGWVPPQSDGIRQFAPEYEAGNAGFEAEYFPELAAREAGHFWFETRNQLLQWALRRYAPDARDYLEVGCGTGFVLSGMATAFPGLRLSGSEIFSAGLRLARQRVPRAQFLQLDARQLPFEGEYDVIGAFDVIEHIEEDEQVLASAHRALRDNGVILLTVPQHPSLWSAADVYARHKRRYVRSDLVAKLKRAGFRPQKVTSFVSLLLPMMWASRLSQRSAAEEFDPAKEFDIHPALNKTLRAVLFAENALIRAGASLPAGGSLLAVAQKQVNA